MPVFLSAFFIALFVAIFSTPFVSSIAAKTGALDKPDSRKVHNKPIPRIGGVAIYFAFMFSTLSIIIFYDIPDEFFSEVIGLIISASIMFAVGLIDDYKNLPARIKLLGQIFASAVLVIFFDVRIDFISDPFGDYIYLEFFAIPATIFWLVGITNTVNLIDGLDGLAAGISSIAAITILLVAMEDNILLIAVLTAAIAGAAIGFLFYNFNPASIFMGDSGALFLGFCLAGISVIGAVKSATTIALFVPILALGLPILDTACAIIRRFRGHIPIFKPDKGHLHHRLLALGFSQRQAVLLMYVVSALLGLSALALTELNSKLAAIILILVFSAVIYGARKIGIFSVRTNS